MILTFIVGNMTNLSKNSLQTILWLDDWEITWDNSPAEWNMGECTGEYKDKSAHISIATWLSKEDRIKTIIHELLHCHTSNLRDLNKIKRLVKSEVFSIIEEELERKEEEIVEALELVIYNLLTNGKRY